MDKIEVCQRIKKTIRHILIQNQSKVLSSGTGIVVREDGVLITAKHVIEEENIGLYNGKITAKGLNTNQIEYKLEISGPEFDINLREYINPISIDLAILKPTQKIERSDFVPLCNDLAEVGTDVVMAGFPDDLELPLNILEKLNKNNLEMAKVKKAFDDGPFKYYFRQLMFKHAMIGQVQKINLIQQNITGATYWIDNHLTYGGSGGPIVNLDGELLGIICKKAFTDSKMSTPEKFPSGTGMALSHHLISWLLNRI